MLLTRPIEKGCREGFECGEPQISEYPVVIGKVRRDIAAVLAYPHCVIPVFWGVSLLKPLGYRLLVLLLKQGLLLLFKLGPRLGLLLGGVTVGHDERRGGLGVFWQHIELHTVEPLVGTDQQVGFPLGGDGLKDLLHLVALPVFLLLDNWAGQNINDVVLKAHLPPGIKPRFGTEHLFSFVKYQRGEITQFGVDLRGVVGAVTHLLHSGIEPSAMRDGHSPRPTRGAQEHPQECVFHWLPLTSSSTW